jgi:transposase-like protein
MIPKGESGMRNDGAPIARLSDKQALAIDLIATGMKVTDVAATVGISREQLWRWRTHNQAFSVELARRRAEMHQATVDRFWLLSSKALDVAEESLDERDPQMAIDILRLAARGMTDLRLEQQYVGGEATGPNAVARGSNAATLQCPDCGVEARSKAGLTRHRDARHSN